jgi:tetratricopeptide (TPR) repeat protein
VSQNKYKSNTLMKNPLRALFLPLVAFMLFTVSACDKATEDSGNTLLRTGAKIGNGALQGSLAEFTKAIQLDPKSVRAYAGRGALKYAMGDSKGAIADLTKAIELDPKSVTAYSGRASAKFAAGDIAGATADFLSVARLMVFSTPIGEAGKESGKESGSDAGNEKGKDSGKDSGN